MQIIMNETEIVDAIKSSVLNQMSINEGMTLEVDLRATRGDTGYTAEIIISPEVAEKAPAKKTATKKAAAKATPAKEPAKEADKPAPEPEPEAEATPEVVVEEAKADEPAEERPTTSIFGALKKPVNS